MSEEVTGNTQGLKASEIKALERLYRRRVAPTEIVSSELAQQMALQAAEMHRQVGVLIDRRGAIQHVMVGDASKITLPDFGRIRGGQGRFRGLRLVHTHLRNEALTRDDMTDLALMRLDAVAAIAVDAAGHAGKLYIGHLVPDAAPVELPAEQATAQKTNFLELITQLEQAFGRAHRVASTDVGKDRALLVHVDLGGAKDSEARIAELRELCRTAGVKVLDVLVQRRPAPDPKFLVGRGKLDEILLRAMQLGAEVVIFDPDLSPGQARAISEATELKVLDRTMLILDIFAQHATSRDGKLQVELAQLRYALPRLIEKNTMMSRLTGGIGGRGPGETKLEINRRRARDRINLLEKRLGDLADDRRLRRKQRERRDLPIIAICGYTNAGKSTLLNAITAGAVGTGDALAADKLFATLDPISRRLRFPHEREVIITDTVGFIRDLPKELIAAFRATLEEMEDADLLVHVVDASDPDRDQEINAVEGILADLGLGEKPRILVWNKADRVPPEDADYLARQGGGFVTSALDRATLGPLLLAIERALWEHGKEAFVARVGV
ncbi:MAG TPA: GTPase HflX [Kofleriaceae bacterium]